MMFGSQTRKSHFWYSFLNRWNSTITTCFWTMMAHNALNSTLPWLSTCWTFLRVCFLWSGKRIGTLIVNMLNILCVCVSFSRGRELVHWLSTWWTFCMCISFGKGRELLPCYKSIVIFTSWRRINRELCSFQFLKFIPNSLLLLKALLLLASRNLIWDF